MPQALQVRNAAHNKKNDSGADSVINKRMSGEWSIGGIAAASAVATALDAMKASNERSQVPVPARGRLAVHRVFSFFSKKKKKNARSNRRRLAHNRRRLARLAQNG